MNIVRLFNKNRKKIIKAIIFIAFIIILIQILNHFAANNDINEVRVSNTNSGNKVDNEMNSQIENNSSAITGDVVENEILEQDNTIINKFITFLNNRDLESAYEMLTNECKEEIYPSIDLFENNYYNNIFDGETKIYSIRNWVDQTYLVTLTENILATGNVNSSGEIRDYITVVNDKINISSYIGREEINEEREVEGIYYNVLSRDIYMDYEIYNIEVTNRTQNRICLALGESSEEVEIIDTNSNTYEVYNHEIIAGETAIPSGATKEISFRFYSAFVYSKEINVIKFSSVIMDYDAYLQNTESYNNFYELNMYI